MVKTGLTTLVLCLFVSLSSQAQTFSWKRVAMDGSRTGVIAAGSDNVRQALGSVEDGTYIAPNGREFKGGATPKVAKLLLDSQNVMKDLKQVVAYAPKAMIREYPECALSDWFVDVLMEAASEKSGKKVDFGITNFGGIRVDLPQGDILYDDIMSMFPFKNNLCYLELRGCDIRALLNQLASSSWQVVGGARCVVKGGKLQSAIIGSEPLDDEKTYGVATISFLLNGGDGLSVAKNAKNLQIFDEYILDIMLPYVKKLTSEGRPIEYQTDGRIQITD